MILSGNQNQFISSFTPLRDLLKALMFFSNLNDFNSSPSPLDQIFSQWKGSSKVWKEKGSKWFSHFFSLPPSFGLCITCVVCILVFESVWFYDMLCLTCLLSVCFQFCFILFFIKKNWKIKKIQKQCVFWIYECFALFLLWDVFFFRAYYVDWIYV